MITYRTCLFDMRLDDLWDPDQRWALLSDTASKHSQSDPVVFLYEYYFRPQTVTNCCTHVEKMSLRRKLEAV